MTKFTINGKEVELDQATLEALLAKKGKGASALPDIKALQEKYPWIGNPSGLSTVSSGGAFKYTVPVTCQAGKVALATSRYSGPDSITPIRVDHKTNKIRPFDYTGLPECGKKMEKATSDLFQSHLCDDCRGALKGNKKKAMAAIAKQLGAELEKKTLAKAAAAVGPAPAQDEPDLTEEDADEIDEELDSDTE